MPARTPLFRLVAKSLAAARTQARTGLPWEEAVVRRPPVEGWSRRKFLGGAAATAAGLAVGGAWGCRTARPARGDDRVVVVGAGIAGLVAAYRLRQAGVAVRLLEAQSRVGGRMWSLRGRFADGQVAELGGELIDTGHERLRRLCHELAIELDEVGDDDPGLESEIWYFGGARRTTADVVAGLEPFARRIDADLAALGDVDVDFEHAPPEAVRLDRLTLAEWLASTPAEGWVRDLLRVAYTTEYGLDPGDQSSLNLLLMLETDPFAIFGASDERFHVRGGNDRVISELAARLPGAVETGVVLEAVTAAADGSFRLAVRRGSAAAEVPADHLVLALPFTQLRGVHLDLPLAVPAQRRAIAELGYGTNAKLMIGFSERVWRLRHGATGSLFTDLSFQTTWEASRKQPGRAGILTNFTGGAHGIELGRGTAAEQAAAATAELERVFPGLAAARAGAAEARFHWPSFCWAGGSYASYRPGQWTTLRGAEGRSHGRLHFAGEHCSREAQGFMEGGCETGESAAAAVLARLGLAQAA